VAIGDAWKLIDVPAADANNQQEGGILAAPNENAPGGNAPTDEMQRLMAELEQLDKSSATLPPEKVAENIGQRADLLEKLAEATPEADRDQWYRQLADLLCVAVQSGELPQGTERLEALQNHLTANNADAELISHVQFQRMFSTYVASQNAPGADTAKLQGEWVSNLQAFVNENPKASDSAEALLQLGFFYEALGKSEDALKSYQQLVTMFPKANQAAKASGAIRRLGPPGTPMKLSGKDLQGNNVDLASYRGKVVLVHYWATWSEPSKQEMVLINNVYAKRGGQAGNFEVVAVCLDNDSAAAKQFLVQNRFPWKHIHEKGGLDSRLANEMGVITLPLMILVDQKGNIANNDAQVGTLESELARLAKPADAAANALRGATTPR
jgi:tetratricopeptide (TPR) repeat protein